MWLWYVTLAFVKWFWELVASIVVLQLIQIYLFERRQRHSGLVTLREASSVNVNPTTKCTTHDYNSDNVQGTTV